MDQVNGEANTLRHLAMRLKSTPAPTNKDLNLALLAIMGKVHTATLFKSPDKPKETHHAQATQQVG